MKYLLITKQPALVAKFNFTRRSAVLAVYPNATLAGDLFGQLVLADEIALDIESTGLNPWLDKILLVSLWAPSLDTVIVIDTSTVDADILNLLNWKTKLVLGHNFQFDGAFLSWVGVTFYNVFDTMVTEIKLTQGSDLSVSLIETLKRRKIDIPEGMDKDIRLDFIKDDFILEEKHIIYAGNDVLVLFALKEKQDLLIDKFNLGYFIRSIHNPLVLVLIKMRMGGFKFNASKWGANADAISMYCTEIAFRLNGAVENKIDWQIINTDYAKANESKTKGIARASERIEKLKVQLIELKEKGKEHLKIFAKSQEGYIKANEALEKFNAIDVSFYMGINWSSSKQVLEAFGALGMKPIPKAKSATTHQIQPSVSHAARDSWLLANKDNQYYELMEWFHDFKNHLHTVNSFGHKWIEKYLNPVTDRVHTIYRQNAATGRLTSGNAKEGLYNSQQIPAGIEFRHCFIADEGRGICTIDYSGAELCFMASLAHDERLIELSKGDMHSYFANKGWEAIYNNKAWSWTEADIISSKQNKQKRTDYKPMMFGTVYGLRNKKAAETLNVTVKEGQIAINTIVKEIPKTIAFVEQASKEAFAQGYVIHNTRTNSRRWFIPVLEARKSGREISFMDKSTVESAARNTKIQGSQGDLIMEALVMLDRWITLFKIDANIMITVHDEIVFDYNLDLDWFPERAKLFMERIATLYIEDFLILRADLASDDEGNLINQYWTK